MLKSEQLSATQHILLEKDTQVQLAYWKQQLANAPTLELPTDRPRQRQQTYTAAQSGFAFSRELIDALKLLSHNTDTTLYMTLVAAFKIVLQRYSGQDDILIGSTTYDHTNRDGQLPNDVLVNTLVLRTDLSRNPTFLDLLKRVSETINNANTHADVPFEALIKELHIERDTIQVLIALEPSQPVLQSSRAIPSSDIDINTAKFDITLKLNDQPDSFDVQLTYDANLWNPETMQRMLGHWRMILEAVVADPTQHITDLPMLTAAERQQLLVTWNDTVVDYPAYDSLHQLVEKQVERTPEAIALVYEEQHLTYQELNARANQLAHYLRAHGVSLDQPVGLFMPRSLELLIGLLGILKAGGAYVPFDASYPLQRLAFMMQDAEPALLLTQHAFLAHARDLTEHLPVSVPLLCLDQPPEELTQQATDNPQAGCLPENLAYVMYTSGSTGQPKGVALSHEALCNLFAWQERDCPLRPGTVVLQFSPIGFDVSCEELFSTWQRGGKIVELSSDEMRRDPEALLTLMEHEQVERWFVPYAGLQNVALWATQQSQTSRVQLHAIMTAGEQLQVTPSIVGWLQQMPDCTLYNYYGPTESHAVTAHELRGAPADWPLFPPIGRPVSNTQMYVLDRHLQPVPIHVAGELYIGGANLARGYIHRPELTAERFVPNVWSQTPGARLYRTGDLARYCSDGAIEFLGRGDQQVKLRGYRIEPGEIEAVLQSHPAVQEAVVVLREEASGEKSLVAYVVVLPGMPPSSEELRRWLGQQVPDYMVPARLVFLDALPLTPSGKLDRRALPAPDQKPLHDGVVIEPRTPLEELVRMIWADLLHQPPSQISIHDNFFELGGHSLLVTQVISRLRQSLHVEVPNRSLFEMPTIALLAEHIDTLLQLPQQATAVKEPDLTPMVRPDTIPASFSQQSLWFLQQLDPTNVAYNLPSAYRLEGPLVISALEQSLNALVERHETLRTTFASQDGQALQVIRPQSEYTLHIPIIDMRGLSDATRETYIEQLARHESQMPFDLATGPLLRVRLLRVDVQSHVLLLTTHHIIFDGWSTDVLLRDLTSLYQTHVQGIPTSLSALPIQYADYALWQKQVLQGQVLQDHLNYWQQHLEGAPSLITLPPDRPRPAVQTNVSAQQKMLLPVPLYLALKTLSQQEGVTLFMTLLAAFQVVFMRSSGQTDLVIGVPVANRSRREVEDLLGYFVNTLALRTDLSDNPSFQHLLTRVRDITLQAYVHQDIAFEQVVQSLQIERSLSYPLLFQIMFSMQTIEQSTPQVGEVSWNAMEIESTAAKFDLTFDAQERADGLHIEVEYNTSLYDASTIERLLTHWQVLLQSIIEDPTQPIESLSMLTEAEREQLLVTWNDTTVDYPAYATLCQLFEAQVERRPNATAVTSIDGTLSYQELNGKANQLARMLRKRGVQADTLVGICMDRSTEMLIALLGILKAGGAYVPIDPVYPADRIAYMLEDSQIQCLLTQHHLLPLLSSTTATIICLDREWDDISQEATDNVEHTITANNLAYILYTSGSTGRPKGVQIPHRGLINFELAMRDLLKITEDDTFLAITTLSFDIAGLELYLPLISGAQVSIETREVAIDGHQLLQRLQEVRPTVLQATPATWHMLLTAGAADFSDLTILCGGEALSPELRDQLLACKPAAFWNVYGPTETTVWSVVSEITSSDTAITIGHPIANMQTYILDANQQPVPIGIIGELYIGGAGMGRGYLNQPELTQEKFIPHLFRTQTTERLYRTGDLARYLEDGTIDFLGRIDHQVKIRGFRIELGEIETVLQQIAEIQQAVVTAREDTPGDKRLVAYMITGENPPTIQAVRTALKEKLPIYMVPAAFVFLEAFPLTPNGKIDRKVLPVPTSLDLVPDTALVAPRTSTEELLAHIWANVLNLQQISVYDNFFELGGHSLLVAQVISRLRQSLHVEVPNRSLFEMPTIATLAQHLDTLLQLPQQAATGNELALTSMVRPSTIPASFSQQSLWFLQQLDPTSVAYNIPLAYCLEGPLVLSALQQSLNELVYRHETLHTVFADQDGQAIQVIMPAYSLDLPVIDIQGLHGTMREEYIQQLARQESQTPFHLEIGPLLRVRLLRVDEQSHVLLLNIHHIVFDGWSIDVLLRDLTSLYQARVQGEPALLPALPIQYADYALWQKQVLQGQVLQDHLNYWQQHLKGAPNLITLSPDRPRPAIQTRVGAQQNMLLPAPLYLALKTLSQQEGVTLFMTLLAAFQVVLMRSSGQTDLVIGTPVANRSHTEVEDLLGYFVNTLALRTDLSDNPSFQHLLTRVRDITLQAYAHQDIAFEQVVQSLQIERSSSYSSVFQVMFSMQHAEQGTRQAGGVSWNAMETESTSAKFDLTFEAQEQAGGIQIRIEYNTNLYDASTIERLLTHWQVLLDAIIKDPTQPIESLSMLTDAEEEQILKQVCGSVVDFPALNLIDLFEQQVVAMPDAQAVTCNDITLTYRELNAQANSLAHRLRAMGVERNVLAGLCTMRSVEMIVGLLAILKAGGAYVALDPQLPTSRLQYQLDDTKATCVVTQASLQHLFVGYQGQILLLDEDVSAHVENLDVNVQLSDLAYIIYTSGSTGTPKGVLIPHSNISNYIQALRQQAGWQHGWQFATVSTLAADLGNTVIFGALISGGCLHVLDYETATSAQLWSRYTQLHPLDVLKIVPSHLNALLAASEGQAQAQAILPRKQLIMGGESLDGNLLTRLAQLEATCDVINHYGPTETTIGVLTNWLGPVKDAWKQTSALSVPIGKPLSNIDVAILNAGGHLVPIGVVGELYIAGAGVARGYLNQPEQTATKFLEKAWGNQPPKRYYRTGDLAKLREDGMIEFIGRIDHQVKIRGFRIELGEIETVLKQIAEIKQAVVIDHEDTPGDKRLVAYMVAGENQPTFQTLRATIKEKLPEYMIPAAFVFLDALPLTPNGKINRKALPVPDMSQAAMATDSKTQPSEIMHYQLLNIWEQLLATNSISIKDNFFDLGGHSLLAARMLARIEQVFGKKISLSTLFAGPTIEDLTRVLMQQTQAGSKSPLIPVQVAGLGSKKPFFFLHGDWSGGAYYCFKLARKAGSDQPFYVIEPSIFPENREIPSIEGQAAAHLELVRSVQSEGPYYLGGYCNGGIIAYEMAQQLQAQGEQVKFLTMIDPPSESMAKNFARFFNNTLHLSERPQWKIYLYTRHIYIRKIRPLLLHLSKTVDEQLTKGIQVSIEKDQAFAHLLPSMKTLKKDYSSIFAWAFQHYTFKPYHGKITFIWAREELAAETDNFWNDRAQVEEAESHVIAGSHYGIVTDEIETFAEFLGTSLQKAQAQNADTPNL